MSDTVVIFNPQGAPEKHSRANARDLVQHCDYSWIANLKAKPNHPASFAGQPVKKSSISQEVLDRATGDADRETASKSAAERGIEQEAEEQRKQLAAMMAAAEQAGKSDAEVADYSMPAEEAADPEVEAAMADDGDESSEESSEDDGSSEETKPTRRRRVGRNPA